ncbi:unnamed protein product [Allacma fusca]|uniref:Reverse transcriptase domain-containing protein n=1 Tax=Allacma fusca TaxID=39272 RepID=A0A8J2PN27_9HEXA|nr:unnamed protein product [Allacma fusca]
MKSANVFTVLTFLVLTFSFMNLVQPTPMVCPPGPCRSMGWVCDCHAQCCSNYCRKPLGSMWLYTRHETLDQPITESELSEGLKHLKNGKAVGPDEITNEFLKHLPPNGKQILLESLNGIFENKDPPVDWSQIETVMIFKKSDASNPNNFRPITLANTTMKPFTHIMEKRLSKWAETNKIIPEAQARFRRGRRCMDHICTLNSAVQIALNEESGKLYALFIDFEQAFP